MKLKPASASMNFKEPFDVVLTDLSLLQILPISNN